MTHETHPFVDSPFGPDRCRDCDRPSSWHPAAPTPEFHDLLTDEEWREAFGLPERAAPRSEGLPSAPVAVRDALHATFRPATPRGEPITEEWLNVFTESLTDELRKRGIGFTRLSRPSDEKKP